MNIPSHNSLVRALVDAASAHHDYQKNVLGGEFDKQWPGWYGAYVLGRLGDFTSPSNLTKLLSESPGGDDWNVTTAQYVLSRLG